MKLSHAVRYALQALVYMANETDGQLVASHVVAEAEGIPELFLLKVLKMLVSARILQSLKGPSGGYRLARPANKITLLEVVEAVDGPMRGRVDFSGHGGGGLEGKLLAVCERAADHVRSQYKRVRVSDLAGQR